MDDSVPRRSRRDKTRSGGCTYGSRVPQEIELQLTRSLQRLDDRVRRWSHARWAGAAGTAGSPADVAYQLVCTLADLGRQAGNGAPVEPPSRVGAHAIADQIVVVGRELTSAPDVTAVAEAAVEAVERASREI